MRPNCWHCPDPGASTLSMVHVFKKDTLIYVFSMIFYTGMAHISDILLNGRLLPVYPTVDSMAADDLVRQGPRASADLSTRMAKAWVNDVVLHSFMLQWLWFIITWLPGFFARNCSVALDGGMCKATTLGVKQSRVSQWTATANHRLGADMVYCDYAWTCDLYIPKTISYMFMVIDDST